MKLISSFVEINCRICDCQLFYVDCIACLLGFSVFEKQEINNRKTTDINFEEGYIYVMLCSALTGYE